MEHAVHEAKREGKKKKKHTHTHTGPFAMEFSNIRLTVEKIVES